MSRITLAAPILPSQTSNRLQQTRNLETQNRSALQEMRARQEASVRAQQIDRLSQQAQTNPQAFNQLASLAPQRAKQIQDIQINRALEVGRISQSFNSQSLEQKYRIYPKVLQDLQSKDLIFRSCQMNMIQQ